MLSHRAPAGMLMIDQGEMARMNGALVAMKATLDGLFFLLGSHKKGKDETPQQTLLEILRKKKDLSDCLTEMVEHTEFIRSVGDGRADLDDLNCKARKLLKT